MSSLEDGRMFMTGGADLREHIPREKCYFLTQEPAEGDLVSWKWDGAVAEGGCPPARAGHAASIEPGTGKVFAVAGKFSDPKFDAWVCATGEGTSISWSQLSLDWQGKAEAEPRAGHACVVTAGHAFVFGGKLVDTRTAAEIEAERLAAEEAAALAEAAAEAKAEAAAEEAEEDPYAEEEPEEEEPEEEEAIEAEVPDVLASPDLVSINLATGEAEVRAPSGQAPCPRQGHTMVVIDGHVVLYGGKGAGDVALDDMFLYNVEVFYPDLTLCYPYVTPNLPLFCTVQENSWRCIYSRVAPEGSTYKTFFHLGKKSLVTLDGREGQWDHMMTLDMEPMLVEAPYKTAIQGLLKEKLKEAEDFVTSRNKILETQVRLRSPGCDPCLCAGLLILETARFQAWACRGVSANVTLHRNP